MAYRVYIFAIDKDPSEVCEDIVSFDKTREKRSPRYRVMGL